MKVKIEVTGNLIEIGGNPPVAIVSTDNGLIEFSLTPDIAKILALSIYNPIKIHGELKVEALKNE